MQGTGSPFFLHFELDSINPGINFVPSLITSGFLDYLLEDLLEDLLEVLFEVLLNTGL